MVSHSVILPAPVIRRAWQACQIKHGRREAGSGPGCMGKNKKKRQRQQTAASNPTRGAGNQDDDDDDDEDDEFGGLEVAEIATAIRVVTHLSEKPELFASKLFKPLRAALDPLVQLQLKKYDPVDYALRVTAALQHRKAHEALLALQGMRSHGQLAKQGTVQRWVRDCDPIPNESGLRVRLLQAVLRASTPMGVDEHPPEASCEGLGRAPDGGGGTECQADASTSGEGGEATGPSVIEYPAWDATGPDGGEDAGLEVEQKALASWKASGDDRQQPFSVSWTLACYLTLPPHAILLLVLPRACL